MGLFDGFMGTQVNLTPKVALAAAMIYVSAADGHLDPNEKGDIFKVVPDDNVLEQGLNYVRRTPFQQFLQQSAQLLSPQQKLCLILNVADMAMGDGFLAPQEQAMLIQLSQFYQIPDAHLQPYVQALMIKNNLSVFG
jgi:uncharacterized tellurite resistance protein B-like protein